VLYVYVYMYMYMYIYIYYVIYVKLYTCLHVFAYKYRAVDKFANTMNTERMRETLRKEVRLVNKVIISRHVYDLHDLYLGEQRTHAGDATNGGSPCQQGDYI